MSKARQNGEKNNKAIGMTETPRFHHAKTIWSFSISTGGGAAYFSIKLRKFIQPFVKRELFTEFRYKLLPGEYILLKWSRWCKEKPPYMICATLVQIQPSQHGRMKQRTISTARWRITGNYKFSNPILADFFSARITKYPGWPSLNFNKVYSEEDVEQLIQLIQSGVNFTEGEETE
jgi:hypothetical protein